MLAQLFDQYGLKTILDMMIQTGRHAADWWVVDDSGAVIYRTTDSDPQHALRRDLVAGNSQGAVLSNKTEDVLLADVMHRFLSLLLVSEVQRAIESNLHAETRQELLLHQRLSRQFGTMTDRRTISQELLSQACIISGGSAALVYVKSMDGFYLLDGVHGRNARQESAAFRMAATHLKRALTTKEVVWLDDNYNAKPNDLPLPIRYNAVICPLLLADDVLGILTVVDKPAGFAARDIRHLQVLASYASIAYHNAFSIAKLHHHGQRGQRISPAGDDADWQEVFEHSDLDWREATDMSHSNDHNHKLSSWQ